MTDQELLGIGGGLARGFDQGMKNYVSTMGVMQNLNQKKELFAQQKKINKAKIDMLGLTHGPEARLLAENKMKLENADVESSMALATMNTETKANQAKTVAMISKRKAEMLKESPEWQDMVARSSLNKDFGIDANKKAGRLRDYSSVAKDYAEAHGRVPGMMDKDAYIRKMEELTGQKLGSANINPEGKDGFSPVNAPGKYSKGSVVEIDGTQYVVGEKDKATGKTLLTALEQ